MSDVERSKEDLFGSDSEDDGLGDVSSVVVEKQKTQQELAEDLFDDNGPSEQEETDEEKDDVKKEALGPPITVQARWKSVPKQDDTYLLKLTNVIGVQPNDFNPDVFKENDDYDVDGSGKRRVRPSDQAVIRWRLRKGPNGEEISESNAKFIRWSDGSLQLKLGDEYLDVITTDITNNHAYLFVEYPDINQGQTPLTRRMALRPVSLTSKLHQNFISRVGQNDIKLRKVANTASLYDVDREKEERMKAEAREREYAFLQRRQAREAEKYSRPYGGARPMYGTSTRGVQQQQLNSRFLEADEDAYDDDDDGGASPYSSRRSKDTTGGSRRGQALGKRGRRDYDDEEEEEEEYVTESEEDEREVEREREKERERERERPPEPKRFAAAAPTQSRPAAAAAAAKPKARRGVVMSDEESD